MSICPECENDFRGSRCYCGYTLPPPKREWTLRECVVEGCHVMIRALPENAGPGFCKWHQDGKPHRTQPLTLVPSGPFIDRNQFGLTLYEAVKCCGAILQLQEMQQQPYLAEDAPARLAEYQRRETGLLQQLAALVPKLSVSDQEALLERYPRLFT